MPDRGRGRLGLSSVDELDVGEDALQRGLDAVVEGALLRAARAIELHQRVHVRGRRGTTERALGQRGDDGARAALFLASRGALPRLAGEDPAAARGVGRTLGVERTFDRHLTDVRIELEPRNLARRVHRAHERPVQFRAGQIVGRDEGHADVMQTGLDRNARRGSPVALCAFDFLVPVEQLHALAVDRDLELLARDLTEDGREVPGDALDAECVVAVGRKLVRDQNAAARAERQAFDVVVLRGVRRDFEDFLARCVHVANREAADLARRRQIRFHQRRRHRQRAGDVVEAAGRVVGRQELGRVHFEREQVANRIRVLGAIHPVQAGRRQMGDGLGVELGLHPPNQRLHRVGIRTTRVGRRHLAGAKLADDALAQLAVCTELREIELCLVEHQSAGLHARVVAGDTVLIDQFPRRGLIEAGRGSIRGDRAGRCRRFRLRCGC